MEKENQPATESRVPSFAEKFRNLPILEKEKVTNFFNLHNAATWMYMQMSDAAKDYCNEAISCSQTAMQESVESAESEIDGQLARA